MRAVFHADLNAFYASVACVHHPELRRECVVVGGSEEQRHGIVLAKNQNAKAFGIKTGETLVTARKKCPNLVVVPPDFSRYLQVSRQVKDIYRQYTDRVESFGIDEAWLDVTQCTKEIDAEILAHEIRRKVYRETGLTVSIGVSWNKVFAKFGSDYKKPNGVTVITPENMKDLVWPSSVSNLLYVGRATEHKLLRKEIHTIGELAQTPPDKLRHLLGKWGLVLHQFANGYDHAPVTTVGETLPIKTIGNSTTTFRDLSCEQDVRIVLTVLAESVSMRLRETGFLAGGVAVQVRGKSLMRRSFQTTFPVPTDASALLIEAGMRLFNERYLWPEPLRSVGIKAISLMSADRVQPRLFTDSKEVKQSALDQAVDDIRRRFGNQSLVRAELLKDPALSSFNPKEEHTIHPDALFKSGSIL